MRISHFVRRFAALACPRSSDATWLVGPTAAGGAVPAARDQVVVGRVGIASRLCAVLILAWSAVDLLALSWWTALSIGLGRVLACAAFAALAVACRREGAIDARRALAIMFAIPLPFYVYAMLALWYGAVDLRGMAITTTYIQLPFIATACIALFPLAVVESAALALPWLVVTMAVAVVPGAPFAGAVDFGVIWLLAVVTLIATVAAGSQLRFMSALIEQSSRDVLTGTLSRRVGAELLALQFNVAQRQRAPLAVVFLDLDVFKAINDGYGHSAGDAVLKAAGATLMAAVRRQDAVIRWGGEEFVLLLPGTNAAGAAQLVARIGRTGVAKRPDGATQTASVGIAELTCDAAADGAALVALADARMYRAKQAGRNRVLGPDDAVALFHPLAGGGPATPAAVGARAAA